MSERIKRYKMLTAHPERRAFVPLTDDDGDWCRSTDVAAIEAENARLRRIVEAGDKLRHFATNPPTCASEGDELEAAVAAYDAAKQTPANGEGPIDTPEPIGSCPKCGAAVYAREGFCGLCQ